MPPHSARHPKTKTPSTLTNADGGCDTIRRSHAQTPHRRHRSGAGPRDDPGYRAGRVQGLSVPAGDFCPRAGGRPGIAGAVVGGAAVRGSIFSL